MKILISAFLVVLFCFTVCSSSVATKEIYYVDKVSIEGNGVRKPWNFNVREIEKMVEVGQLKSYVIEFLPRVTGYKGTTGIFNYVAVKFQDLLERAVLVPRQERVPKLTIVVWAPDKYYASFSWGELFNSDSLRDVYLAYKTQKIGIDSELQYIPAKWGGPFRLVVPLDKINDERSVKWVKKIFVFYPLDFYPGHEYK